jgi:signal transduction histidine kinase
VRDFVDRTQTTTIDRSLRVDVTGVIPTLDLDPVRIEQVLSNLLVNAIKYGEPGTAIGVTIVGRDAEVEIAVTNQGPGIPAAEIPQLFTRFYRSPAAERGQEGGLGLGLYISKGIVEAHAGRLWAVSTLGETTQFFFTLPVPPPS